MSGRILALALLVLASGCSGGDDVPSTGAPTGGAPRTLAAHEIPTEIGALLSASASDSCGVCEREKQADAFALADTWLPPGTVVRPAPGTPLRVIEATDHEVAVSAATKAPPRLTFRFHTRDEHLIGIDPTDFTDDAVAAAVLDGSARDVELVVVPFAYGEGPGFLFDAEQRRIQVQCRVRQVDRDD